MLALAEIDSGLKGFERRYATELHDTQRAEIKQLAARVREGGLDTRSLIRSSSAEEAFAYRAKLQKALMGLMREVRDFGADQVKDEIGRQAVK